MANWGGNNYSNGNQGGYYQDDYNSGGYDNGWQSGNQSGYGGGYGNQFGFSTGRGGRGQRGKKRGSNNYNYNNNPEWYSDGYNNGGYNNGYNDDTVYGNDGFPIPFPFGGRGSFRGGRGRGRGGNNPAWQRGAPQWSKGPRKQEEVFKKKANGKKKLAVPEAVVEAGPSKRKKKRENMKQSEARLIKYKHMMTLKNKYRSVRQNKHLGLDDQLALVLLKRIMNEMCEGDMLVHCINFSKLASRHPNALKLFSYEAKKQLDKKYDPTVEEEKQKCIKYLQETKEDIIEGFKKVYKQRAETEDMEAKERLLDVYISKMSGDTFTDDDIPVDEDYLFNKDHSRREEDFIKELTYDFVFNCYESFKFKPVEVKTPTKDVAKRIRFHLEDNPIIPFLLVESVRTKTLVKSVPSPINKYIAQQNAVHQDKNESCLNDVVELMVKNKDNVVTPISKYMDIATNTKLEVFRDFADCILLFDRFATYIKFRLLKYSPHILLPVETKEKLFNELVDKVYRQSLDILMNDERFDTKEFVDMEKDEEVAEMDVKEEVSGEPVEGMETE